MRRIHLVIRHIIAMTTHVYMASSGDRHIYIYINKMEAGEINNKLMAKFPMGLVRDGPGGGW